MAEVSKFLWWRHLRSEPSVYVMHYKSGQLVRHGRGLAFWFWPLPASLQQIPMDDRELQFHFPMRSRDFQDVSVQGVITWRVSDPALIATRVDFSIDTDKGVYNEQPLENLSMLLTQLAQQFAASYLVNATLSEILSEGYTTLRNILADGLGQDDGLRQMGIEIVSTRVAALQPTAELERALQMPTREQIQQAADEATFQRRALAVEKERAIQENELENEIELARRKEKLITQRGANQKRDALERAEAQRISAESDASQRRIRAAGEADANKLIEETRVAMEEQRMDIYRTMPSGAMMALAAQELAGKLQRIEHLNISPEMLGPLLNNLISAGTAKLEK